MTFTLDKFHEFSSASKRRKIVGRGPGSGLGKTSGRGHKGMGARSGYKVRHGKVGGGVPLHRRLPTRGFSNAQFARRLDAINLGQIEAIYDEGDTVTLETLREKGYIRGHSYGIKVLGKGELKKKVAFQVEAFSEGAKKKLSEAGIKV